MAEQNRSPEYLMQQRRELMRRHKALIDRAEKQRQKIVELENKVASLRKTIKENNFIDIKRTAKITSVDLIKKYVEQEFDVDMDIKRRYGKLPEARRVFFYFATKYTEIKPGKLAVIGGGVHRTTVLWGAEKVVDEASVNKSFQRKIYEMDNFIYQNIILQDININN